MIRVIIGILILLVASPAWAGFGMVVDAGDVVPTVSGPAISDDFSSDTSANYTNIVGTLTISGGTTHGTAWDKTVAYHETSTGSLNHWARGLCSVNAAGTDGGCVMVGSNGTEYYYVYFDSSGHLRIYSNDFAWGLTSTSTYTLNTTHDVVVEIATDGSSHATFRTWVDGSLTTWGATVTDTGDNVTRGNYIGITIDRDNANADHGVDDFSGDEGTYQ